MCCAQAAVRYSLFHHATIDVVVVATATVGLAALILILARTAHSVFKTPT